MFREHVLSLRLCGFVALFMLIGCSEESGTNGPTGGRNILDMMVTNPDVGPDAELATDCEDGDTRVCRIDEMGRSVPCADPEACTIGSCTVGTEGCNNFGLWSGICDGAVGPAEERCDEADNDCDEQVDEGFNLGTMCEYRDANNVKRPGTVRCDEETGDPICEPARDCTVDNDGDGVGQCEDCDDNDDARAPGRPELCDGIDNNCNDTVDEDFLSQLDRECQIGVGECERTGRTVCSPTGLDVVCEGSEGDTFTELCDGLDNDCDGRADEDYQLDEPCLVGIGACATEGTKACDPTGSATVCNGTPAAEGVETCNGIDDDCDGTNDEGFGVGGFCEVGTGACKRSGTTTCSANGDVGCSAEAGTPSDELCNGIDDNCNGEIDEGNPESGDDCNSGLNGICRAGVRNCLEGRLQCVPNIQPATVVESCNGQDDDCDGVPDNVVQEIRDINGNLIETIQRGSPCTNGLGACNRQGFYRCEIGVGLLCNAEPGPPLDEESCNGEDDDCDGATDERAFPRTDIEGNVEACENGDPTCARLVPGADCTTGLGECTQPGQAQCSVDTLGVVCGGTPNAAEVEACDGLDNDCDGQIDERNPGGGANCSIAGQLGECSRGQTACQGGSLVCNPLHPNPEAEVCDGLDTDCDGKCLPGEGCGDDTGTIPNRDPSCTVGQGECERAGTLVCDMNLRDFVCDANPGTPQIELCDGLDNNCNGDIDENNPEGGMSCTVAGQSGRCSSGTTFCQNAGRANAQRICQQINNPIAEVCNGEDDNCNGLYDEGYGVWSNENAASADDLVANTCANGLGVCFREGVLACTADGQGSECSALQIPPAANDAACNRLDDDCDGLTDEDANYFGWASEPIPEGVSVWLNPDEEDPSNLVGRACAEGCGPCRNGGQLNCSPDGQVYCSGSQDLTQTIVENCDGIDGNCNCLGDWEEFTQDSGQACRPLSPGRLPSACEQGTQTCEGGPGGVNLVCTSDVEPGSQAEDCDGINNDCDGAIDEAADGTGSNCNVPNALGECSAGTSQCTANGDIICTQNNQPTPEKCDFKDNDCDGEDDEDFLVGAFCDSAFFLGQVNGVDVCGSPNCDCYAFGVRECVTEDDPNTQENEIGQVTCTAEMPVQPGTNVETCDDRDNDCDGSVDEDFALSADINNCGACGFICPGPSPECIQGECFRTYYVDPDGSNALGDGSLLNPWRTINYAADTVDGEDATAQIPPARIYLKPGRYADRSDERFLACASCAACNCPTDTECRLGEEGRGCYLEDSEVEDFPIVPDDTIQIVGLGADPSEVVIDGGTLACYQDESSNECRRSVRTAKSPLFQYESASDPRGRSLCQTNGTRRAYCSQQPYFAQRSYGTRNLVKNLTVLRGASSDPIARPVFYIQTDTNLFVQDLVFDDVSLTGTAVVAAVRFDSELVMDRAIIRRTSASRLVDVNSGGKFYGNALGAFFNTVTSQANGMGSSHRRAFFEANGLGTEVYLQNSSFANNTASILHVGNSATGTMNHCSVANLYSGYAAIVDGTALKADLVNNAFQSLVEESNSGVGGGFFIRKPIINDLNVQKNLYFLMNQGDGGRAAVVEDGTNLQTFFDPISFNNQWSWASNNFEGDPKFKAPGAGNLKLEVGSACVDAAFEGDFEQYRVFYDYTGTERQTRGNSSDIGAYESLVDP